MEEDLKKLIKKCDECKLNECINCEISYSDIQTIKHLIQEYKNLKVIEESHRNENGELRERVKQLEEENERLKGKIDVCNWQEKSCRDIIDEKYIPVSLVKEKIEELEENGYWNYLEKRDLETTIEILQELLEKR